MNEFPNHMKIYYIANARMPTEKAHGIQLAKMCEAFIERGVELELIVPNRKTSAVSLQEFYGLRTAIPLVTLPVLDTYNRGRIGFFLGSCTFMLAYVLYLWYKRLRGRRGIVYTTDIDQFSFIAIPLMGLNYFVEIHDAKKKTIPFSVLFKYASGVVTINRIIREELMAVFGIRKDKIIVHPNGIDLNQFNRGRVQAMDRRGLNIAQHEKIVLYSGKCYPWKGLEVLAEAARLLPSLQFHLVGDTAENLLAASGVNDIPSNLVCAGHRDYKEMPVWLSAADIVLLLGTKENEYSYRHTSPMKLFEYMASGRPVIASRTPANQEIVSDAEVLFYEPDNARNLADKIAYALEHAEEMKQRAARAYEKVKGLTWEQRAGSILDFIVNQVNQVNKVNQARKIR